jgi:hypothetical protein
VVSKEVEKKLLYKFLRSTDGLIGYPRLGGKNQCGIVLQVLKSWSNSLRVNQTNHKW